VTVAVDPLYAQWLQRDADTVIRYDASAVARWGNSAAATARVTAIATRAAASAEADRQLAFFSRAPFAIEVHQFASLDWIAAIGTVITVYGDNLGYDAGIDVFVLGAEPDQATGISSVTVLRPLKGVL
jgi:hypothetical protein